MRRWHFDGRGQGKTRALIDHMLQAVSEEPNQNVLALLPTAHHVSRVMERVKERNLDRLDPLFYDREKVVEFANGSCIYFKAVRRAGIEEAKGLDPDFIACDEYGHWPAEAYPAYDMLRQMIEHSFDEFLTITRRR